MKRNEEVLEEIREVKFLLHQILEEMREIKNKLCFPNVGSIQIKPYEIPVQETPATPQIPDNSTLQFPAPKETKVIS